MHQGYQFLFFDCQSSAEPPVNLFLEGEKCAQQVFENVLQWFSQCVEDEIATYVELK